MQRLEKELDDDIMSELGDEANSGEVGPGASRNREDRAGRATTVVHGRSRMWGLGGGHYLKP